MYSLVPLTIWYHYQPEVGSFLEKKTSIDEEMKWRMRFSQSLLGYVDSAAFVPVPGNLWSWQFAQSITSHACKTGSYSRRVYDRSPRLCALGWGGTAIAEDDLTEKSAKNCKFKFVTR
jgi:hypothetical protein